MKLKREKVRLKKNRFDLEQAIMDQWSTADDIMTLFNYFYERHEHMTVDEVANALLGIHQLAQMRGELAFEIFENMVHSHQIKDEYNEDTQAPADPS